jgi:hypothetical protein
MTKADLKDLPIYPVKKWADVPPTISKVLKK